MVKGLEQQKLAVQSGLWPLYRYDPRLAAEGKNPLQIDCKEPTIPVEQYMYNETRFRMLTQSNEGRAEELLKLSREDAKSRWSFYSQMAAMHYGKTYRAEITCDNNGTGTPVPILFISHTRRKIWLIFPPPTWV